MKKQLLTGAQFNLLHLPIPRKGTETAFRANIARTTGKLHLPIPRKGTETRSRASKLEF